MSSVDPWPGWSGDWKLTTIGSACDEAGGDVQTGPFGSQLHASDYVIHGIPSVMPQDLKEDKISTADIARISEADAERLDKYRLTAGDIVYSRRGDVERRALVTEDQVGWLCGTGCLRVRLPHPDIDSRYLFYYLGHPDVRAWVVSHAQGATMPNLNTSILRTLPLAYPSLSEQQVITATLGALDDKIELNHQMNRTLEEMAQALFQSWFVDFEGESDLVESELGLIPRGWEWRPLQALAELQKEGVKPQNQPDAVWDLYSIPAFDSSQSPVPELGSDIKSLKYRVPATAILVSKLNPRLPRVWRPSIETEERAICSTEFMVFVPRHPGVRPYLYELLRSQPIQRKIQSRVTGTTGSRQRVRPGDIATLLVLYPGGERAQQFSETVAPIHERTQLNIDESRTLAEIRDTLLPKLISGEIRVPEAEEVLEEVV